MKGFPIKGTPCVFMLLGVIAQAPFALAAKVDNAVTDEHIRAVVESLLREKDKKIERLEARIKQLESNQTAAQPKQAAAQPTTNPVSSVTPDAKTKAAEPENLEAPPGSGIATTTPVTKAEDKQAGILGKLGELGEQIEELKEGAKEKGLDISGFFDVNAKTPNSTDQTFSVGSVELDLEYAATDHFAASSALVLCGNSAGVDSSAPAAIFCGGSGPGGLGGGQAGIAVAFADFHMFDNNIPPRGRIFSNQGFHVQAGRFDIPFATDYQNFANTDRVTVTAPITTSRMQFGGFNGDGIRSYGSWKHLNYSVFWTDALYATDGTTVGGRLGLTFGQNNYRSHHSNPEGIEVGVSYLADMNRSYNLRRSVYSADLTFGYGFLRLLSELMITRAYDDFVFTHPDTNIITNFGRPNELGYHATLLADLEQFIDYPVIAFARYGRWEPRNKFAQDFDGTLVRVENISALTVGLNYRFNEYLKLKFEYTDSLGSSTTERFFDKHLGIAQMVVSF